MNFRLAISKVVQRVREAGLRTTVREALERFTRSHGVDEFDRRNGTNTGGEESLWNFKIDSPSARFGRKYQPSSEAELADAVRFLGVNPREMTFIDLGCGKGRTLLVAAGLGFRRVIGVEFAQELAAIARKNLEKMKVTSGTVVQGDAGEFRFPDEDLVLYLYNPFSEEIMRRVVLNLRDCAASRLYVVYKVPECRDLFDSGGFLTPLGHPPERQEIQTWELTARHARRAAAAVPADSNSLKI